MANKPEIADLPRKYASVLHADVRRFIGQVELPMWINGELRQSLSGSFMQVEDPATARPLCFAPAGTAEDIQNAVHAADDAFAPHAEWARFSAAARSNALLRIADVIEERSEQFSQLESLDTGKPIAAARGYDIPSAVAWFRYFAGWPTKIEGSTIPGPAANRLIYTIRQPVGVVGQIIPWNFPLLMAAWKLAPALAAGCTCVLKPAEQTPLTALFLAALLNDADILPRGVINVVTGTGEEAGAALVKHTAVRKLAFTGSRETAQKIVHDSSSSLKRLTLELGGKSPNVVLDDVDPAFVAREIADAAFLNQGENCCAGSRVLVHDGIYESVLNNLCAHAADHTLGHGLDESTTMGPLVSGEQQRRVRSYIDIGEMEGARLAQGGGAGVAVAGCEEGYFIHPTVFVDVEDEMTIAREEVFGPVVVIMRCASLEEMITRANRTEFGLAAGIWTSDLSAAHRLAQGIDAGTIWINTYNETDPAVPFGGFKASGIGREHGREVLDSYLETKAVWVNLDPLPPGESSSAL